MKQYFETQRLICRSWQEEDISHLARLNSDDKVMEYFLKKLSYQETIALYNQIQEEFTAYGFGAYAVEEKVTGAFIGFVGLHNVTFEVDFAPVDNKGFVDVEALAGLIRHDTILISIMAVNNEIGSIQPIEAISELLADKPTISFHVDAVQALAKIPTEKYLTERVDFATFSGHKFHGVRGVGFVYIKSGKKITPLLTGGGQERDYRSTTENVAGIAATAKALRLSMEKLDIFTSKTGQMKVVIRQALLDYPDIFVFSDEEDFAPHILTFGIKGVRGEVIVHAFEDYDIFISTTSACSSKAGKPAGTLIAMGVDKDKAQSAVRLSLDLENDMSQVEQFLSKLKLIYNQTRKVR